MNETNTNQKPTGRPQRPQRQLAGWKRVVLMIVTPLFVMILKSLWALWRFDVRGGEKLRELATREQEVVFGLWHEGLLVMGWFATWLSKAGFKVTFLISPSKDGEIGVQILAKFGARAVRGSARRSGAAALRGLIKAIRDAGQSPIIALDGSKGPRRYCKPGAIMVARMAGVPLVPLGCAAQRYWRASTWDQHVIPKPFSKVVITVGDPYTVPREMDSDGVERWREDLESRVNTLNQQAEETVSKKV